MSNSMKKIIFTALSLCLLFSCAIGESLPENAIIYEHPGAPLNVYTFTPLADGSIVLAGQLRHEGQYRDMPEHLTYEIKELEILNDAAAVRLAPDGTKRWEIRLADPQAENAFFCQGLLPDGRLLMSFRAFDSASFGSHHFIVSQDGIVEEMLPTIKISQNSSIHDLRLMPSGFLSDGARYVNDIFTAEYPSVIVMRDFDGNELWRYAYQNEGDTVHVNQVTERPDGYFVSIGRAIDHSWYYQDSILKLDRDGKVLWTFTDDPAEPYGFGPFYFPEDGGIIFAGTYDPDRPEDAYHPDGFPYPTLTKVDDDGHHVWSMRFDELIGIGSVTALNDGYVLMGSTNESAMVHEYLLLYVDSEGKIIGRLPITGDGELVPWPPNLLKDAKGNVFVYANLAEPDDMESRMSGDVKKFFFARIDENSFK